MTMRDDKRITQDDIDRVQVRLKPLLGVLPGRWLAALYALAAAALLFLALVLPGLRRDGSLLSVDSRPRGSAVHVDGAYAGTTPCEVFVERGDHRLAVSRPSFSRDERLVEVGGRVFASILFPRRQSIQAVLAPARPAELLSSAFAEFGRWSLSGRPSASYQFPLVLSDALLALAETGAAAALPRTEVPAFSASALAASAGEHSLRDALRASILAAAGGAPSPVGLAASLEALNAAVGSNPALAPWLESVLPQAARERLAAADGWAALKRRGELVAARVGTRPAGAGVPLAVAGLSFRPLPAGSIVAGGEGLEGAALPYEAEVPAFSIAETEVTRRQWAAFIAAVPAWAPANRETLRASGQADESYLADWGDGSLSPDLPVTGVSWAAATAYCEWLSSKAPAGLRAALPSELQWERAALAGSGGTAGSAGTSRAILRGEGRSGPAPAGSAGKDGLGLADMLGNVWEWCSDAYSPAPALVPAGSPWSAGERSVRGASWANRPGAAGLYSRGSFPPSFSSPFLGFRPVLVRG
jgi:formylglycine-generating enzyme required for sulfatase activity